MGRGCRATESSNKQGLGYCGKDMFVAEEALGTDYQRRFRVNCTVLDSGMGGIQCSSYNIEVRAMDVAVFMVGL